VTYRVRFVCTDKGQHARRRVGQASMASDGWVSVSGRANWAGEGGRVRCPRCGRNPHLTPERWTAAMRGLRDTGITEVDISDLPF
jgi:hypothetical protein